MTTGLTYDAVVAGTGPSGAMVARELAKRRMRVLILEKGSRDASIRIPKMLRRREMLHLGSGRTLVRGVRTGGSSMLYYGTAGEPPEAYFRPYGISLAEEAAALRRELPIAPLEDRLIGPRAARIMASARALGLPWRKLDKFIRQERCAPGVFPADAQWNATELIQEALDCGAELWEGAEVGRVLLGGKRAEGVAVRVGREVREIRAGAIVLAAGGVGTPGILRRSGVGEAGNGFFCDPLVILHGLTDDAPSDGEIPMAAGLTAAEEGYMLSDISLPGAVYQALTAQTLRLHRIARHRHTMSIMVKIQDELGGSINAGGRVRKRFTDRDAARMRAGLAQAEAILRHAGARRLFRTAWTSAHPGGSARIGETVDANLAAAYDGLYVCDCSVLPEPWGRPPTFTLLCLAKRLANHLSAL